MAVEDAWKYDKRGRRVAALAEEELVEECCDDEGNFLGDVMYKLIMGHSTTYNDGRSNRKENKAIIMEYSVPKSTRRYVRD